MYRNQRRYMPKNHQSSSHSFRNRSGSKGYAFLSKPHHIKKKLDANLFIKRAKNITKEVHIAEVAFSDFAISDKLKRNIAEKGYTTPTIIQEQTIPHILEGQDVIGIANTGTGKTAAFLIPLINKVFLNNNERVLIIIPTRELAIQIIDELRVFTKGMDLESLLCIGGANMHRQEERLRHDPHFIIGTPGRLKDLITRRKLNLSHFRNVVLDEVDRMVDIGFIHDVTYFISLLPKERQSLFFSATVSDKVKGILQSFVNNPVTVSVKQQDTSENVDQNIIRVNGDSKKIEKLHELLVTNEFKKVLIFGRTKWGIEKLTNSLIQRGFKAVAIHGNKSQGQRQRALEKFKQNEVHILLATDVASRGLDIDNVTHVINYDAPESYDDYIHRIGRTGRAGKKGVALTFVD